MNSLYLWPTLQMTLSRWFSIRPLLVAFRGSDAMQTQQMALESSRRCKRQLISVDQALKRLEERVYGICVDCDEDINMRRLKIDPTAIWCIKCAAALSK